MLLYKQPSSPLADDGITLFAFHGQLNVAFNGHEAGTWSRDIVQVQNGRFVFRDCNTKLQSGDVIYFWTFMVWHGLGLHQDDGQFGVDINSNMNAVVSPACAVQQSMHTGGYQAPPALLTILQPRGFEVSIPGMCNYGLRCIYVDSAYSTGVCFQSGRGHNCICVPW